MLPPIVLIAYLYLPQSYVTNGCLIQALCPALSNLNASTSSLYSLILIFSLTIGTFLTLRVIQYLVKIIAKTKQGVLG